MIENNSFQCYKKDRIRIMFHFSQNIMILEILILDIFINFILNSNIMLIHCKDFDPSEREFFL